MCVPNFSCTSYGGKGVHYDNELCIRQAVNLWRGTVAKPEINHKKNCLYIRLTHIPNRLECLEHPITTEERVDIPHSQIRETYLWFHLCSRSSPLNVEFREHGGGRVGSDIIWLFRCPFSFTSTPLYICSQVASTPVAVELTCASLILTSFSSVAVGLIGRKVEWLVLGASSHQAVFDTKL
jgi:hypothetical protein